MPGFVESNRFLFLKTPLGADKLLLESFTGQEGISQLFSFQLELLSEDHKIKFGDILGQMVSFGVNPTDSGESRTIHGMVSSFTQLPSNLRMARYRAEVVPKFWLLTRQQRSRIFQGKNAKEILTGVLKDLVIDIRLSGSYPRRDYCVQYRETDFNFACRLMEEEGIFYYFKHAEGSHTLILGDRPGDHDEIPGTETLLYDEVSGGGREEERISNWQKTQEIGSGKYTIWDYDYLAPRSAPAADSSVLPTAQVGTVSHKLQLPANSGLEVYDYPGGYARFHQNATGNLSSEMRDGVRAGMQEMDRSQFVISGDSNVHWMTPGTKFKLDGHPDGDAQYVLTRVVHAANEGSFYSEEKLDDSLYSNTFECLPMTLPYRPARAAEKPHVWGCQTAVVVGPGGEEIYTDQYSRVKVQFHWDRDGQRNADSSCWVRVASFWAGNNWGAIHIPRIGQEVIVDFLEGDPDQPIIIGSVYNASNMPPYSLPANKTQSGILSRSSKGGGAANANEIRFEDKKGSEQLLVHAEKNQDIEVENDETHWVGHDRKKTIDNNETVLIKKDHTIDINGNDKETVKMKQSITVNMDQETTVMKDMKITVMSGRTATITGKDSLTTMGGLSITTPATISITAGGGVTVTSGAAVSVTSGAPVTITAPMITLNAAMVTVSGVLQCTTLIAAAGVISPMYTPGAGNIF